MNFFPMSYYSKESRSIIFCGHDVFCYEIKNVSYSDIMNISYDETVMQQGYAWKYFGVKPNNQFKIKTHILNSLPNIEYSTDASLNRLAKSVNDYVDDKLDSLSKSLDTKIKNIINF
jgi:hypothetical protein